jgi:hypothetical protein
VENPDALYNQFRSAEVPVDAPTLRPWGLKEMYVTDPDGSLLMFGERVITRDRK